MIGIAARSGVALGLNLRMSNPRVDPESKEARKRLWWSIVFIEHRLSVMTGRVSCLGDGLTSATPLLPLEGLDQMGHEKLSIERTIQWTICQQHEQIEPQQAWLKNLAPGPSLHFFYLVDLTLVAHAITNRFYSTDIFQNDWSQIESQIRLNSNLMDRWVSGLHVSLRFEDNDGNILPGSKSHYQVSLALNYYSARIILNRPCFTRPEFDEKNSIRFRNSGFGDNSALTCLHASLSLVSVLPDQPDAYWAYHVAPWWSVLHFLMQATTVLLIFLLVGPVPMRADEGGSSETGRCAARTAESLKVVLTATKKALHWLHYLGRTDEASRRAFELCNSFVHRIGPNRGLHLGGIPFTTVISRMLTTAHYSRQQDQGEDRLQFRQLEGAQGFSYNEANDNILLLESTETQTASRQPA